MKFRILHVTEYVYGEPVPLCHHLIRLRPRETALQSCDNAEIDIKPTPATRRDRVDFFGNHVTWVSLQEPHSRLKVTARSEVETTAPAVPNTATGPAWEQVPTILSARCDPISLDARQYTYDSPQAPCDPALAAYALPSFPAGKPVLACVADLTQRIFREFVFDTRATTIGTPVLEVLEHRRGVCQDFAHLQVACLRSLGLPARYVSGYIMTRPPPGQPRLVGADASHAWASVYVPDYGWVDFDPTNGCMPAAEHITLGWARDYDDISPTKGVITGGHGHTLFYSVDVEPLDLPAAKPAPAPADVRAPNPAAPAPPAGTAAT